MAGEARSYRLSPRAIADLEEIWLDTRETWSARQAERSVGEIVETIEALCESPSRARAVDIREDYLKHPAGSHMIYFRLEERALVVIRVLHQRRDVARHL